MSRIGKIARLPVAVREELNERLQDGQNGPDLLAWLNGSDEVKAVLAGDFESREITESNLSHWRLGGYRDWQMQQSAMAEARLVLSEGAELADAGQNALADKMAVWMLGQYLIATRKLRENADDPNAWKRMREVCHDLAALRRGDHDSEWLRLDRERIELHRRKDEREERKEAKLKSKETPAKPPLTTEERQRRYRRIFGMEPI